MLCGRPGLGDQQMCPAFTRSKDPKDIQVLLNGSPGARIDETPYGIGKDNTGIKSTPPSRIKRISYFSIRLDPDEWIVPGDSAILDGASVKEELADNFPLMVETTPGNYLLTDKISHDDLPSHPFLTDFVLYLLK